MKSLGIIRQLDALGRIVIPIEMRRKLDISVKDPLEITVEGSRIVIEKHREGCVFCNNADGLREYEGKPVCSRCLAKLKNL